MTKKRNSKIDLKDELKKKKLALKKVEEKAREKFEEKSEKIIDTKEKKLEEATKKARAKLQELDKEESVITKELEQTAKTVEKDFAKKIKTTIKQKEKVHRDIIKKAEKQRLEAQKQALKHVDEARKEYVSVRRKVYTRRRKIINVLQFIGVIYLFILSVTMLKDVAFAIGADTVHQINTAVSNPINAFGAGWLTAILVQSASIIAIIANSLMGAEALPFNTGFYILVGLTLGNSVTPIVASLILKTKTHWDLRHGFELGLSNAVYSFFLITIVLIVQFTTGFFTTSGETIRYWSEEFPAFRNIPDLLDIVTNPIMNLFYMAHWPIIIKFLAAVVVLVFSLQRFGKSMFIFMGGRRHTRAIIEKFLKTYWRGFLIGLGLTIIIPSASLLVTLLVPLAITRIVNLRQAIPYIIGTSVGTFIDVLLAAFANGEPYAIAGGSVLMLISMFGVLFIIKGWGVELIYKTTRYLSLHMVHMKKRSILSFLIAFTLFPALIVLIFR